MLFRHNLKPDEERRRFIQWHTLSTGVSIMLGAGFGSILTTIFGFTFEVIVITVCFSGFSYILFAILRIDLAVSFFDSEWHQCQQNWCTNLKQAEKNKPNIYQIND